MTLIFIVRRPSLNAAGHLNPSRILGYRRVILLRGVGQPVAEKHPRLYTSRNSVTSDYVSTLRSRCAQQE